LNKLLAVFFFYAAKSKNCTKKWRNNTSDAS